MRRLPVCAAAMLAIASPAVAEDCWEVRTPAPHRAQSPAKPRPPSLMRVYRIRLTPPMTHRTDVLLACEPDQPADVYMTVIIGPTLPEAPDDLVTPPDSLTAEPNWLDDIPPVPTARPVPPREFFGGGVAPRFTPATAAIPEPSTWGLLILGFVAIGWAGRRRRARRQSL